MNSDNFGFFIFVFIVIGSIGYFLDKLNTKEIRNKLYIKLDDYKEKEYIKTEFEIKFDAFSSKIVTFILKILAVIFMLIIIGLIIWAIVTFPIAAIIILLILILLK